MRLLPKVENYMSASIMPDAIQNVVMLNVDTSVKIIKTYFYI